MNTNSHAPARPVVRYHGGKWQLGPWIISYFPDHEVYTEPFGGGGSVLMQKPRSNIEIYNDLDLEIVTIFRVLRDTEKAKELERMIRLTPFAREEFVLSYEPADNDVELARRAIFRSFAGHNSVAFNGNRKTGFRANSNSAGSTAAQDWANYPDAIQGMINRLKGVVIENRPAIELIKQQDSPETLHYVDPPYVHSTRRKEQEKNYKFELTDAQHIELADVLRNVKGMVVLSGYQCDLYDQLYKGWKRVDRKTMSDAGTERTECLWISPKTVQYDLFSMTTQEGSYA